MRRWCSWWGQGRGGGPRPSPHPQTETSPICPIFVRIFVSKMCFWKEPQWRDVRMSVSQCVSQLEREMRLIKMLRISKILCQILLFTWNAAGRAKAPVPTIRLNMKTAAVTEDMVGGPLTRPASPPITYSRACFLCCRFLARFFLSWKLQEKKTAQWEHI